MNMSMNLIKMGNQVVEDMSLNEMGVLSQQINDMRMKRIIEQLQSQDKDIELMKQEDKKKSAQIAELQENNKQLFNTVDTLRGATYVIATDDGKRKEMKNRNNSLAYKACQGKKSIMDKLFHQKIVQSCYSHLYKIFEVNAYTRIKVDDYDIAMKAIDSWYASSCNVKKAVNMKVNELSKDIGTKDKEGNNIVKKETEALFNIYMEMTDGNQKPFINKKVKKSKEQ